MAAAIDCFGPFALDRAGRRLTMNDRTLALPDRHIDVLLALTRTPGVVFTKDQLIEDAWHGVAVGDDSLYLAIRDLRHKLGPMPDGRPHIETHRNVGFRFAAPIERRESLPIGAAPAVVTVAAAVVPARPSPAVADDSMPSLAVPGTIATAQQPDLALLDRLLAPHLAFINGRRCLETLDLTEIAAARDDFRRIVDLEPGLTAAHVGLATAHLLRYESTRADAEPDRDALAQAAQHAQLACTQQPAYADAWGAYAHVLHRLQKDDCTCEPGSDQRAVAAAKKALSLEPAEWRHHFRLAFLSSGGERLRAAQHVLELNPGFAMAHWMIATVFVSRGALVAARDELRRGCLAQDAQAESHAGFPTVGLHLLHGLVLAALGDHAAAHAELAIEDETARPNQIYTREVRANAGYARGMLSLREGDRRAAVTYLESALASLPSHPLARVAHMMLTAGGLRVQPTETSAQQLSHASTERALVHAAILSLQDQHAEAARLCEAALAGQRSGAGAMWQLLVEPMIHATARPDTWARAVARLKQLSA